MGNRHVSVGVRLHMRNVNAEASPSEENGTTVQREPSSTREVTDSIHTLSNIGALACDSDDDATTTSQRLQNHDHGQIYHPENHGFPMPMIKFIIPEDHGNLIMSHMSIHSRLFNYFIHLMVQHVFSHRTLACI